MIDAERGVVLEIKGRWVTVLTPRGDFCAFEVNGTPPAIGEELMLPPVRVPRQRLWVKVIAAAAVFLLLILSGRMLTPVFWPAVWGQPAYYVSVDINPSLEITVSDRELILEARPLNEDGKKLLAELKLKGRRASTAIRMLTQAARERGYLTDGVEGAVVLTVVPALGDDREAVLAGDKLAASLAAEVRRTLGPLDKTTTVAATTLQPVMREHAREAGLSAGKYGILIEALDSGLDISPQELRDKNIAGILGTKWQQVVASLKESRDLAAKEVRLRPRIEEALRCGMASGRDAGQPPGRAKDGEQDKEQGRGKGPAGPPDQGPGSDSRGLMEENGRSRGAGPSKATSEPARSLPGVNEDPQGRKLVPTSEGQGRELLDKPQLRPEEHKALERPDRSGEKLETEIREGQDRIRDETTRGKDKAGQKNN